MLAPQPDIQQGRSEESALSARGVGTWLQRRKFCCWIIEAINTPPPPPAGNDQGADWWIIIFTQPQREPGDDRTCWKTDRVDALFDLHESRLYVFGLGSLPEQLLAKRWNEIDSRPLAASAWQVIDSSKTLNLNLWPYICLPYFGIWNDSTIHLWDYRTVAFMLTRSQLDWTAMVKSKWTVSFIALFKSTWARTCSYNMPYSPIHTLSYKHFFLLLSVFYLTFNTPMNSLKSNFGFSMLPLDT